MPRTLIAKRLFAAGVAILVATISVASGLANARLHSEVGEEPEQQPPPPKGPLGPSQAGPRREPPPAPPLASKPSPVPRPVPR